MATRVLGTFGSGTDTRGRQFDRVIRVNANSTAKLPKLQLGVKYRPGQGTYDEMLALFGNISDSAAGILTRVQTNPKIPKLSGVVTGRAVFKYQGRLYRVTKSTFGSLLNKGLIAQINALHWTGSSYTQDKLKADALIEKWERQAKKRAEYARDNKSKRKTLRTAKKSALRAFLGGAPMTPTPPVPSDVTEMDVEGRQVKRPFGFSVYNM